MTDDTETITNPLAPTPRPHAFRGALINPVDLLPEIKAMYDEDTARWAIADLLDQWKRHHESHGEREAALIFEVAAVHVRRVGGYLERRRDDDR